MPDDWKARITADALARVDQFILAHPEFSREGIQQPAHGSTNHVVFARRGDEKVVFKIFCEAERKQRECFGLAHWRETGLVPQLVCDAGPVMIAVSWVPGHGLGESRKIDGDAIWRQGYFEAGRAIGLLTRVPMSATARADFESQFYQPIGALEAYAKRILELGRGIQSRDPDFRDDYWRRSLDYTEAQLDPLFSQPRVLYHQDVSNFHVESGRFKAFFDLEMCRVGCEAMQLASAFAMFGGEDFPRRQFQQGWEAGTGKPLISTAMAAAVAGRFLLGWREISRYLSYDGAPGTGYAWASPADPRYYRDHFDTAYRMLDSGGM